MIGLLAAVLVVIFLIMVFSSPVSGVIFLIVVAVVIAVIVSNVKEGKRKREELKVKRIQTLNNLAKRAVSEGFNVSKTIEACDHSCGIIIDEKAQKWSILWPDKPDSLIILDFSDLIKCEILKDGKTEISGRGGSALAGGLLFGDAGAVAGAAESRQVTFTCQSITIKFTINRMDFPSFAINYYLQGKTYDEQMKIYENVEEIAAQMDIIKYRAENGEKRD